MFTLAELAAESGYAIETLRKACAPAGDLPVIRSQVGVGAARRTRGAIRVTRVDWEAWLERHRSGPPSAPEPDQAIARAVGRRVIDDLPGVDRYLS